MDAHWKYAVEQLAALLPHIRGLDQQHMPDDLQGFLASYTPPPGQLSESEIALLRHFASMDGGTFQAVYLTYRHDINRQIAKRMKAREAG